MLGAGSGLGAGLGCHLPWEGRRGGPTAAAGAESDLVTLVLWL